ncbi:MAG: hypothetical protein QRY72_00530 [Candidatus Rhabdochlamydia sp.]
MNQGVMIGCDEAREWMLPWWWERYQQWCTFPVVFGDFGMTPAAKRWCLARGDLLALKESRSRSMNSSSDEHLIDQMIALVTTPFQQTIWLDLDCEIMGSLTPLFGYLHPHTLLSLCSRDSSCLRKRVYNTGVIVYEKRSPILRAWASDVFKPGYDKEQESHLLEELLNQEKIDSVDIPSKYNWDVREGIHPEAAILHWQGDWGKQVIWNSMKRVTLRRSL